MNFIFSGAISGLAAVAFGAFGSHALKDMLSERYMNVFQTASDYQFIHSLALVLVGILVLQSSSSVKLTWSGRCFLLGIILFSGSLYLLSISGIRWLGMITPLGGIFLILGWLILAWAASTELQPAASNKN